VGDELSTDNHAQQLGTLHDAKLSTSSCGVCTATGTKKERLDEFRISADVMERHAHIFEIKDRRLMAVTESRVFE
jgi:hypothetical protein